MDALPQKLSVGKKGYTVVECKTGKRKAIYVLHFAKAFYVPEVKETVGWTKWGSVAEAWSRAKCLAGFGSHAASVLRAAPGSQPPAAKQVPKRPAAAAKRPASSDEFDEFGFPTYRVST